MASKYFYSYKQQVWRKLVSGFGWKKELAQKWIKTEEHIPFLRDKWIQQLDPYYVAEYIHYNLDR